MASGNTLCVLGANAASPPGSAAATADVRNGLLVLDFDASSDEATIFTGIMPQQYAGGGVTVYLHWMATSATSGTCRWGVQFERGDTDIDSDSFATANTAGGSANGTSGIETATSIAFTHGSQMDSVVAGDRFRLKVYRDADGTSGTDDMTGDAELIIVEIRET